MAADNIARIGMADHLTPPQDLQEPPPPSDDDLASARGGRGDASNESASPRPPAGRKREKRKPVPNTGNLATLYRDFAYQYGTEVAWDCVRKKPIRISHLRHTFGHDAVKLWMGAENRRMVQDDEIVFDPAERCGAHCVNLFHGWGTEPADGDTKAFHEVLDHLCGSDETVKDYVLNWYAYPLQNPGAKMPTSLVMHGAEGTGKNLVHEAVMAIYGRHGKVVGQRELESQWNDWQSGCCFVIGDEVVSRAEMRHHKGVLKALITSTDLNIATKFMNMRSERNVMNIVFHSNEVEPLKLDPSDRRYLVIWTQNRGDPAMYARFIAWRNAGGIAHLMHELLTRDLTGWAWHEPPPMTAAKADLIELGRLSPERFWREWIGKAIDGLPPRSCSADQVYRAYRRWCGQEGERFPMTKPHFSRLVLREAGDALKVKPCKVGATDTTARIWLVVPPPEGVALSSWAKECMDDFEDVLHRWRGNPDAP